MDAVNRFDTRATHLLMRLEYLIALGVCTVLFVVHLGEVRWLPAVRAVRLHRPDRVPPGRDRLPPQRSPSDIPKVYYVLYNTMHSFSTQFVVVGLWVLAFGWEWALLVIPIHLLGDRALFGNTLKPFAVRSSRSRTPRTCGWRPRSSRRVPPGPARRGWSPRRCRHDRPLRTRRVGHRARSARRRHEPGDDRGRVRPAVLAAGGAAGHAARPAGRPRPGARRAPTTCASRARCATALSQEYAFRSVAEEKATRALSYLVAIAPSMPTMEFYATQVLDEARHAMVFRNHLVPLGFPREGLQRTIEELAGADIRAILDPLEEFGLEVMRDHADFVGGVVMMAIILEGALAPAAELSERKWRPLDPAAAEIDRGAGIDEIRHLTVGAAIAKAAPGRAPGGPGPGRST